MNELSANERKRIEALTKEYAATLKAHPTKGKYIFNSPKDSNVSSINFSGGYVDGNPEFSFLNDEIDNYPQLDGVQKVRRIVENERAKQDAVSYADAKNAVVRRNRERVADTRKQFENR